MERFRFYLEECKRDSRIMCPYCGCHMEDQQCSNIFCVSHNMQALTKCPLCGSVMDGKYCNNIECESFDHAVYREAYESMLNSNIEESNKKIKELIESGNSGFKTEQIKQIKLGIDADIDVSIYAKLEFDSDQMKEIRLGLEEGLGVSMYAEPELGWEKMKEIRLNLLNVVDPYRRIMQVHVEAASDKCPVCGAKMSGKYCSNIDCQSYDE